MSNSVDDPSVPLCFDTNTLRGFLEAPKFLDRCARRWPDRQLLIPTVVVAEMVRAFLLFSAAREAGPIPFKKIKFETFLYKTHPQVRVVGFDADVVLDQWSGVLERLRGPAETPWPWRWDEKPSKLCRVQTEACAQVCRWPDHAIVAIALQHRALLVTNDDGIRLFMEGMEPGAVERAEIDRLLGDKTAVAAP